MTANLDNHTIAELIRAGYIRADDPPGTEDAIKRTALFALTRLRLVLRDLTDDLERELRDLLRYFGWPTR